jgi:hypothetical protein
MRSLFFQSHISGFIFSDPEPFRLVFKMIFSGRQDDLIDILINEIPDNRIQYDAGICPKFTESQGFLILKNSLKCCGVLEIDLQGQYIAQLLKIHFRFNNIIRRQWGSGNKLGCFQKASPDQIVGNPVIINIKKTLGLYQSKTEAQTKQEEYFFHSYSAEPVIC